MEPHETNANIMQWQPKMILLTQVGSPDWDNGEDSICSVNPSLITMAIRGRSAYAKRPPTPAAEFHPDQVCTGVYVTQGTISVRESPQEVARLRDLALGHELPKPKAVA